MRAVISHGYISESDYTAERISKCEKLVGGYKGRNCWMYSCHKLWIYLDYLYDPAESREHYVALGRVPGVQFTGIRDVVNDLTAKYLQQV